MPSHDIQRAVNRWGARLIPLVLLALIGYSIWVVVVLIGIHHLLKPSQGARKAEAITVLVLYFVLFIPTIICYLRLLAEVFINPGYTPKRTNFASSTHQSTSADGRASDENAMILEDLNGSRPGQLEPQNSSMRLNRGSTVNKASFAPDDLEIYFERDVFECEADGLPRWCTECQSFKPERSHHSKDVNHCVYMLDHFCPWAGGVVAENSHKYFVQFTTYGTAFNFYMLVVAAYFVAEASKTPGFLNINWVIIIILSGLFFLFALGMTINGIHNVLINSTVVDNLVARHRSQYLAVYIGPERPFPDPAPPQPAHGANPPHQPYPQSQPYYPTITYPLPPDHPASHGTSSHGTRPPRTFAILKAPPHEHVYKLATPLQNFQSVMGHSIWDWLLPLKRSPCCAHNAFVSVGPPGQPPLELNMMYEMGPTLHRMIAEAGILPLMMANRSDVRHGRRRKRRRKHSSRDRDNREDAIGAGVPEGW